MEHRLTHIWPQQSRARTLSGPDFLDPVVTVLTTRVPAPLVAAPRVSVIAVAVGPAGGTKHIWGVCQRAFCLSTPTAGSCDPAPQKLLRTPRRPVKATGWTWTNGPPPLSRWPAVFPVRQQLGGRAACRKSGLVLVMVGQAPDTVPPSNQSERGRERRRMGTSRDRCPSSWVLLQLPWWRSSLACLS